MSSPCNPVERPACRHDLVFVGPKGWREMLSKGGVPADPLVLRWSDEGWPTIRRRPMPGETSGVALGLPLPPSAGKKRLSFLLGEADIEAVTRPPVLDVARGCAPSAWQSTFDRLDDLARRHSIGVRVFGSLAWQTLTGLDYVTGRSDLDLLLEFEPGNDLDRLTAELASIEAAAPMRLDGELMREDGAAVNWREFHAGTDQVMVKLIDGVDLVTRRHFTPAGSVS